MNYMLLNVFEQELYNEAKRLVNICYDEQSLLFCKTGNELFQKVQKKYQKFNINIELKLIELCIKKSDGIDYNREQVDLNKLTNHLLKYVEYKKKYFKVDLINVSKQIASEIIKNNDKYKNESIFETIPNLCNKYIKSHNDEVDYATIIMLLEEKLRKKNKMLKNSNINSLVDIS